MQCNHTLYHKLLRNVFMSKKEELEEIAFDIEMEKRFAEYDDDWKRLEKWQICRAIFP